MVAPKDSEAILYDMGMNYMKVLRTAMQCHHEDNWLFMRKSYEIRREN